MGSFVGPDIVTDGLVFAVDAGSTRSYPGSGTTGTDLISSESITLNNGVGFSTDKGGTWTFDGSDDYIQTSFGQNIVSTGFSVNFWFNVTGNTTQFFMQMFVTADVNTVFRIERNGGGGTSSVEFGHSPNGSGGMSELNSNNFPNDIWHSCTIVYNGSTKYIYKNGAVDTSVSASDVYFYTGAILRIAARQDGTLLPINGKMPSVKVYNKALSAAEIQQNYNAQRSRFGL
jgi:hypothetical protein